MSVYLSVLFVFVKRYAYSHIPAHYLNVVSQVVRSYLGIGYVKYNKISL